MIRMSSGRVAAVALVVLAASSFASEARAGDVKLAESLFKEGVAAVERQDWKNACDAFAGSNDADPSPGTQINLGLCSEKQGKTATAWGWYSTAAGTAEMRGQRERAEQARKDADRLGKVLRKLVITVRDTTPGLTVTSDGATLPAASIGRELPLDPGEHVIEVTAKGKVPFKKPITLQAGPGVDRLEVPVLTNAPEETPAAGTPGKEGGDKGGDKASAPANDGSGQRLAGYLVGGGGVLAVIVAGTLFYLASTVQDKADDAAAQLATTPKLLADGITANKRFTELSDAQKKNETQADGNRLAAFVTGGTGIAMVGVGVALVLTAPSSKSAAKARTLPVTPSFGPGYAGLSTQLSF